MEDMVFFSLVLLTFIRIIGLCVSIEFFLNTRKQRFLVFILGWFAWATAAVFPLIADNIVNSLLSESLLVLNGIAASSGLLLVGAGIIAYFRRVPANVIVLLNFFLITMPVSVFVIAGADTAVFFSSVTLFIIFIGVYIFVLTGNRDFSKNPREGLNIPRNFRIALLFGLFFVVIFALIVTGGISYGMYQADNKVSIMMNYFFGIGITILLIVLMVHFEHNISYKQKYQLIDKYSHNLGNIVQVIMSGASLAGMNDGLNEKQQLKLDLIQDKCKEASDLIKEIRKF